jgi:hypothetical protein
MRVFGRHRWSTLWQVSQQKPLAGFRALAANSFVTANGIALTDRLFVVTCRLKVHNGAEREARMAIMKTAMRFQFWAARFICREEAAQ